MLGLVLLDIDLPERDGCSCLREIRKRNSGLPAILMSGFPVTDVDRFDARFLKKPFGNQDLLAAIQDVWQPDEDAAKPCGGLVIDDEEVIRFSTQVLLESKGVDVFVAEDGTEALTVLHQHSDRIGSVLMDWHLRGTDSRQLLADMERQFPRLEIFIVSGQVDLGANQFVHDGVAGCARKPYSPLELLGIS